MSSAESMKLTCNFLRGADYVSVVLIFQTQFEHIRPKMETHDCSFFSLGLADLITEMLSMGWT